MKKCFDHQFSSQKDIICEDSLTSFFIVDECVRKATVCDNLALFEVCFYRQERPMEMSEELSHQDITIITITKEGQLAC